VRWSLAPLVGDEARAVGVQREAEWHGADAFAASTLGGKRRAGSSANQAVLVLGRAVDDGADESSHFTQFPLPGVT
jgi:hypothetical protein